MVIRLGNGLTHGDCGLHSPAYDFNDANLPYGTAFRSQLAERSLV